MKLFLLLLVTLAFGRSNVMNKLLDLLASEEELAFDRGSSADECVQQCLIGDKWRRHHIWKQRRNGDPVDETVSCEYQCEHAWPYIFTCVARANLPGYKKRLFEQFCSMQRQQNQDSCEWNNHCSWQ